MATAMERVESFFEPFSIGALDFATDNNTIAESVATLGAICIRESLAGLALKPVGDPDGTGDWTARAGNWPHREGVQVIADTPGERKRLVKLGWTLPMRRNAVGVWEVVPGPYAIPIDGLGWGRGLLQLDALGDFKHLYPGSKVKWPVDRQAYAACAMLNRARRELASYLTHPLYERAVLARYNCALPGVLVGMQMTPANPDYRTTKGNYGRHIESMRDQLLVKFPRLLSKGR